MDFTAAFKEILGGKKVRRLDWPEQRLHMTVHGHRVFVKDTRQNELIPYIPTKEDTGSKQWQEVTS